MSIGKVSPIGLALLLAGCTFKQNQDLEPDRDISELEDFMRTEGTHFRPESPLIKAGSDKSTGDSDHRALLHTAIHKNSAKVAHKTRHNIAEPSDSTSRSASTSDILDSSPTASFQSNPEVKATNPGLQLGLGNIQVSANTEEVQISNSDWGQSISVAMPLDMQQTTSSPSETPLPAEPETSPILAPATQTTQPISPEPATSNNSSNTSTVLVQSSNDTNISTTSSSIPVSSDQTAGQAEDAAPAQPQTTDGLASPSTSDASNPVTF